MSEFDQLSVNDSVFVIGIAPNPSVTFPVCALYVKFSVGNSMVGIPAAVKIAVIRVDNSANNCVMLYAPGVIVSVPVVLIVLSPDVTNAYPTVLFGASSV